MTITAVRGMNDILPDDIPLWRLVENALQSIMQRYGYREIRFPLLEKTALFSRSVGDHTDIVEKEMFTFEARNGESLTLRPEGTAGCVRAGIEQGLLYNQIQRLWYLGPMFRHERPQRGRSRQFHQCGVEVFGIASPSIDVELLLMNQALWRELGLTDQITLQLNSLGNQISRVQYKEALVAYLIAHKDQLDEDSLRRLETNPLRILDSKHKTTQQLLENAPVLSNYLDPASKTHFDHVCDLLDQLNVAYTHNPRLVRGLDYYCDTVFEYVTTELGAQGTVSAGGRYNNLVSDLGGKATPGVGFALGLERVVELLKTNNTVKPNRQFSLYFIADQSALSRSFALAETLREAFPELTICCDNTQGSFKSQFKRADKQGADIALVLGENEVANNTVIVKYLREEKPQLPCPQVDLIKQLKQDIF